MKFIGDLPDETLDARIRAIFDEEFKKREVPGAPNPPAPIPAAAYDSNPIPVETEVRYASVTGNSLGLTAATPMGFVAGCNWADDAAPGGGTLRLLQGIYVVNEFHLNNGRVVGRNKPAYRVIRSHDLARPAVLSLSAAGYSGFALSGGSNRLLFYGVHFDGNCRRTNVPAAADGAQYGIRMGLDNSDPAGKSCHHIWVKACRFWDTYTGGIGTVGWDTKGKAKVNELFLVEDCIFDENCHGAPWGGSAVSVFYPQEGVPDAEVDDMFKVTIEGTRRTFGFIFRRNIGSRNYQCRAFTAEKAFSDGNFLTGDMWNYEQWGGPAGTSNYQRAALIENNLSFGNGRFFAATCIRPAGGVFIRFNTSVCDGMTYHHREFGVSNEASPMGGWGGWNDSFYVHANVVVYDPAMQHPYGSGVHALSKDGSTGGPVPKPQSCDWNLLVRHTAALGPAFQSATNLLSADPGFGAPPGYLGHEEVTLEAIKAWATPRRGSSVEQPNCPYTPSDGLDVFGRVRGRGTVGAVCPV